MATTQTAPNPTAHPHTKSIKYLAPLIVFTCLALLCMSAYQAQKGPEVINNSTTRFLADTNSIYWQRRCVQLEAEKEGLLAISEERGRVITSLVPQVQRLADTVQHLTASIVGIATDLSGAVVKRDEIEKRRDESDKARFGVGRTIISKLDTIRYEMAAGMIQGQNQYLSYRDTAKRPFVIYPTKPQRWGLHGEPFLEAGFTNQFQPFGRAGARISFGK